MDRTELDTLYQEVFGFDFYSFIWNKGEIDPAGTVTLPSQEEEAKGRADLQSGFPGWANQEECVVELRACLEEKLPQVDGLKKHV